MAQADVSRRSGSPGPRRSPVRAKAHDGPRPGAKEAASQACDGNPGKGGHAAAFAHAEGDLQDWLRARLHVGSAVAEPAPQAVTPGSETPAR